MKKLLIYGAGAIGRGYLPRVFPPDLYQYYYVEKNPIIRNLLKKQKSFTSYLTLGNKYNVKKITILDCFEPGKEKGLINKVDAVLVAVGPRNFMSLQNRLYHTTLPIICFENDNHLTALMQKATGNDNVVFAIPDVITSSSAPKKFLALDPLSIVTENGVCFIDEKVKQVGGQCHYVSQEELHRQWLAKFFIHNTPHCITAYFGNLLRVEYVHEAMMNSSVTQIIQGVMDEMIKMLNKRYHLDRHFLKYYADKEIRRFSNKLLYDPISRVAREPFRKLAPNERLIGAAQLCLSSGFTPENLLIGIMAAFCFESETDPDFHIKHLMTSLSPEEFLTIIIRLGPSEALFQVLLDRWPKKLRKINEIKNVK